MKKERKTDFKGKENKKNGEETYRRRDYSGWERSDKGWIRREVSQKGHWSESWIKKREES